MDPGVVGSCGLTSDTECFWSGASFIQSTKLIYTVHGHYFGYLSSIFPNYGRFISIRTSRNNHTPAKWWFIFKREFWHYYFILAMPCSWNWFLKTNKPISESTEKITLCTVTSNSCALVVSCKRPIKWCSVNNIYS